MDVHIPQDPVSVLFGYVLSSGIAGSYGNPVFNFFRSTVLFSLPSRLFTSLTNSVWSVVSSPRFCQHFFKNSNRLTLVKGGISCDFDFTFAYCYDIEPLLCACGHLCLEKCLSNVYSMFIVGLLVLLLLNCRSSLHTLAIVMYQTYDLQVYFLLFHRWPLHSHGWYPDARGFYILSKSNLFFKFCCLCFGCHMQGFIAKSNVMNSYSKRFIVLILQLGYLIHFELFAYMV